MGPKIVGPKKWAQTGSGPLLEVGLKLEVGLNTEMRPNH